jgi:glucuronate isomerase
MTHGSKTDCFIHEDFLLSTESSRKLYHEYAANEPILDYHSHLPPKEIAEDRRYQNLYEIWLEGDHYKWRAMRANGVAERLCTGDAPAFEKYLAWAHTIPYTLRNPLYHWTHMELKRGFGVDQLLSEKTAQEIWDRTSDQLQNGDLTARGMLRKFNVVAVCTTDDPVDSLEYHQAIASSSCTTRVYPTFRPDKVFAVDQPQAFNAWVDRLAAASNTDISSYNRLLDALQKRHQAFHAIGCRLSDHGMSHCYAEFCSDQEAASIFDKARSGHAVSPLEQQQFATSMMLFFGRLDASKGWTKQMHIGPLRNNNTRLLKQFGPDGGFDSIGDWHQATSMSAFFDRLDQEGALPKTIVYNNNPADNYVFATMMGNFQDGSIPGKMQFGSGWWHLDQRDGMQSQLNALSNVGLLSRFVGMLTDSRSFLSFPRHEYFRRILCDLLGQEIENGLLPPDLPLVGNMVRNICFANAKNYLGLEARS